MALSGAAVCVLLINASCPRSPRKFAFLSPGEACSFDRTEVEPYASGITVAEPGKLYSISTSTQGDVVYLAGNLPLIITVPHGGTDEPADIPDRGALCGNSANDAATIELACELVAALRTKTGGNYPHVIINYLSRSRVDQNRDWGEECNPVTGRGSEAWLDFHQRFFGAVAAESVMNGFGSGLVIDLHGKLDNYGAAVMAGYNLTSSDLSNDDGALNDPANGYAEKSSLRFLSHRLGGTIDFASLVRGAGPGHESFGALLQGGLASMNLIFGTHYTIVPRDDLKKPFPYLSGEYNIRAFGGAKHEGLDNLYEYTDARFISGLQLEVGRELRTGNLPVRKAFAGKVADAAVEYIESNFGIVIL